jgi:hypothetical protein
LNLSLDKSRAQMCLQFARVLLSESLRHIVVSLDYSAKNGLTDLQGDGLVLRQCSSQTFACVPISQDILRLNGQPKSGDLKRRLNACFRGGSNNWLEYLEHFLQFLFLLNRRGTW